MEERAYLRLESGRLHCGCCIIFEKAFGGTVKLFDAHNLKEMNCYPSFRQAHQVLKTNISTTFIKESLIFHAGTTKNNNGETLTNGGRVIAVTSYGNDYKDALNTSYNSIKNISFDKMNYRKDIGFDL